MYGLLEKMPASCRAAIIKRKNNVTLLSHHLMPQKSRAAPFIHPHLDVRAAVGINQHWIFSMPIKIRRLDHPSVEYYAVMGLNLQKFHGGKVIARELRDFIFVEDCDACAVGAQ